MSTKLSKQGTSLVGTSQEELSKLSEKAGMNPSSPAGAKAIGATPQQAAMARTPATKAARAEGQQDGSLAQEERLSQSSAVGQDTPAKLERMKTLGTLNAQVEALVDKYVQQASQQQAALSINQAALSAVPESQRAPLQSALQGYLAAGTDASARERAVVQAGQAMGRPLTQAELQGYFTGAPGQLSNTMNALTPATVKLADIDMQASGINLSQLASDLNVSADQLSQMSLTDLKNAIDAVQRNEFSQTSNASAEALSAVGGRATQLRKEQQALGQAGVAAYETDFQRIADSIQNVDMVQVAGQEMSIDGLLKDERLSTIIANAAMSPEDLAELEKTEPALAAWVKRYKAGLEELARDAGLVATGVETTQKNATTLREEVSSNLFKEVFGAPPGIMTSQELAAMQASAQSSPLWQALSSNSGLKARLERNPGLATQLKNSTKEQVDAILSATENAEADSALADIAGYTPGGLVTPEQQAFISKWADQFKALPNSVKRDGEFQKLVKAGELSEAAADLIAAKPSLWNDVRDEEKAKEQLAKFKKPEDLLEGVFGSAFTLGDFNEGLSNLRAWATTGDPKALDLYSSITKQLTGPDGKFDAGDMAKALEQLGTGNSAEEIIKGSGGVKSLIAKLKGAMQAAAGFDGDKNAKGKRLILDYLKNDQMIDENEFNQLVNGGGGIGNSGLTDEDAYALLNEPWLDAISGGKKDAFRQVIDRRVDGKLFSTASQVATGRIAAFKANTWIRDLKMSPDGLSFYSGFDGMALFNNRASATTLRGELSAWRDTLLSYKNQAKTREERQKYSDAFDKMTSTIISFDLSLQDAENKVFAERAKTPTQAPTVTNAGTVTSGNGTPIYGAGTANVSLDMPATLPPGAMPISPPGVLLPWYGYRVNNGKKIYSIDEYNKQLVLGNARR